MSNDTVVSTNLLDGLYQLLELQRRAVLPFSSQLGGMGISQLYVAPFGKRKTETYLLDALVLPPQLWLHALLP